MGSIAVLAVLVVIVIIIAWKLQGGAGVRDGFLTSGRLFRMIGVQLALGFILAGFIQIVLPREIISTWMGAESGLRGVLVGTAAGAISPGGPYIQFPLLASLHQAGAGYGPIAAFVTAWSLVPVIRTLQFDVPIMGWEFTLARVAVSAAAPIAVGLLTPPVLNLIARAPSIVR